MLIMLPALILSLLFAASVTDAGVSFVRWGRYVCPTGSQVLYKGFMAQSYYSAGGSGAEYLCMHNTPAFVRGTAGNQGYSGMVFGVELEIVPEAYKSMFLSTNVPSGVLHNQDMPCVRCYVAGSSDVMMVPGRQDCGGSGYDLMYKGFLVSELNTPRGRSQFVCLDEAPEGIVGGERDNNEAVVYPVEIGCGSLPCNPYVAGMEAPCAVCTY